MKFSDRHGLTKVKEIIQVNGIDDELRNGLWSLLKIHCWDYISETGDIYTEYHLNGFGNHEHALLCNQLWLNYFKEPLDHLNNDWRKVYSKLRAHFFDGSWYEVYNFIEFVAANYKRHQFQDKFINSCNILLEKEMSAYRFVNGLITQVTEKSEVAEIEEALGSAEPPVSQHLRRSLELLSDRNTPDYRNSVKESISAVESLVALQLKEKKGSLGKLLDKLEKETGLHPALKKAFSSLYGYTSDKGGIRHALSDEDNVDFHDAKFMLVTCSAFINYVQGKQQNK